MANTVKMPVDKSAKKTAQKVSSKIAPKIAPKPTKKPTKSRGLQPRHDLRHLPTELLMHSTTNEVYIFGLDEVGRGCLAGPVVAACSAYRVGGEWPKFPREVVVNDSKLLDYSERKQAQFFLEATSLIEVEVGEASVAEIDDINILHASGLAMFRAFEKIWARLNARAVQAPLHYTILVDGNYVPQKFRTPEHEPRVLTLVKGDQRSFAIAAAAIAAKNHRDEFMWELARVHPGYGWETNVGYSSPEHKRGLVGLGFTDWHRRSFAINLEATGERSSDSEIT